MEINNLPINRGIINILQEYGIEKLYPPQEEALPFVINNENLVLSIPTASGKSLVAYIAIVHRLLKEGGKALYIVPLIALAREKYEELKLFEKLGFKVGISTGDLDDSDPRLARFDIIVCTSEKADSLLRHKVNWIDQVKVLVIDEIHLIHDPERGPTLEVIISHFKSLKPDIQIIALSATIKNAIELSDWLNAKLIRSDWRPVPLREGVYLNHTIEFEDGRIEKLESGRGDAIERLVENSIVNGGQVLVFVNTRKSTVSLAKKLTAIVEKNLNDNDKKNLIKLLRDLKKELNEFTSIDKQLFECIKKGTAFHNAGLSSVQRRAVEKGFKNRLIKCIIATPTLAAGINVPAQRVIIRDLWRYDINFGMHPIPVFEYKQQAGRAGRPRYDTFGEAITIAKNERQKEEIFNNYILADIEPIFSKLGNQSALRMHLLSAISMGLAKDIKDIHRFIDNTFYAYQSSTFTLKNEIEEALSFLLNNGFIEIVNDEEFIPTLFGNRTSSLYIDPLSALQLKKALENSRSREFSEISFLHAVCSTPDVKSLYLRSSDDWVEEKAEKNRGKFLLDVPDIGSADYEWFLSDLKTASLIEDWINEVPEDRIITKYDVGSGDIYNLIETVKWLLYAAREFARMYNFNCVKDITDLMLRVEYGCKKELLNLVTLKGIGRVRARALYNSGFKTINDLRGVPIERLAQVKSIGKAIARSVKEQLGEEEKATDKEITEFGE